MTTIRRPRKMVEEEQETITILSTSLTLDSDSNTTIGDQIEDHVEDTTLDDTQYFKNKAILKRFNELKPQWQYIVSNYLGLDPQIEAMTFKEIGDILGITREAVRQQYELAIKKLKE